MQIEKAPANQENIFTYLTAGAANAHNTSKERIVFAVRFFICLCCEHLQRMFCKIDEVVFLMCRCFFSICRVELSRQLHNDLIFSSKKKSFVEHLHLSDAFIQSDLQCIQVIHIYCQYMCSLRIEPTTFALLTQCSSH